MAPSIPDWFLERLEREHRGELRIRWSALNREWHIEQKVGRGIFDLPRHNTDTESDKWIRARDGYSLVCKVQASSRKACPECSLPLDVPQLKFAEVRCEYCGYRGLSGRIVMAYFPLGEKLLAHLRRIDPTKDGVQRQLKEIDLHNARLDMGMERQHTNDRQDVLRDWAYTENFAVAGLPAKVSDAPWNN